MRISDWSSDVCSSDLLPIARHDWNGAANWRAQLDALLAQDRDQAFDIRKPPLMRLALVRLAPARHCIVWTRPHLTVDGWWLGFILIEVRKTVWRGKGVSDCVDIGGCGIIK